LVIILDPRFYEGRLNREIYRFPPPLTRGDKPPIRSGASPRSSRGQIPDQVGDKAFAGMTKESGNNTLLSAIPRLNSLIVTLWLDLFLCHPPVPVFTGTSLTGGSRSIFVRIGLWIPSQAGNDNRKGIPVPASAGTSPRSSRGQGFRGNDTLSVIPGPRFRGDELNRGIHRFPLTRE